MVAARAHRRRRLRGGRSACRQGEKDRERGGERGLQRAHDRRQRRTGAWLSWESTPESCVETENLGIS